MSTAKQKRANRRNARRSTGPRNTRHSRYNAMAHGLAAVSPVLPHEDLAAFHTMRAGLIEHYQPANMHEFQLIDHVAHAQVRMERSRRFENCMFDLQLRDAKFVMKQQPDPWFDDDTGIAACMCSPEYEQGYDVLFRYDGRAQAHYYKAVNALHRVREARLKKEEKNAKKMALQALDSIPQTPEMASFGDTAPPDAIKYQPCGDS